MGQHYHMQQYYVLSAAACYHIAKVGVSKTLWPWYTLSSRWCLNYSVKQFSKSYNQTVFLWVPQQQAPGWLPTPKRWMHTPMAQSGSVLCPLVMDYCKQEGKRSRREGIAVYVTLIDEANAVGVQRDNNSICVAEGGIKILRALYINTHVCVFLANWCRKKKQKSDDVFFGNVLTSKSSCISSASLAIPFHYR